MSVTLCDRPMPPTDGIAFDTKSWKYIKESSPKPLAWNFFNAQQKTKLSYHTDPERIDVHYTPQEVTHFIGFLLPEEHFQFSDGTPFINSTVASRVRLSVEQAQQVIHDYIRRSK